MTTSNHVSHQQPTPSPISSGGVLGLSGTGLRNRAVSAWHRNYTRCQGDSSAELAGLHKGDVITNVDGKHVRSSQDLASLLARLGPGSRVSIDYLIKTQLGWMPKDTVAILAKAD